MVTDGVIPDGGISLQSHRIVFEHPVSKKINRFGCANTRRQPVAGVGCKSMIALCG